MMGLFPSCPTSSGRVDRCGYRQGNRGGRDRAGEDKDFGWSGIILIKEFKGIEGWPGRPGEEAPDRTDMAPRSVTEDFRSESHRDSPPRRMRRLVTTKSMATR